MIRVTDEISIDEAELSFEFIRAGGPGGQHVNKAATAVQLRFDIKASVNLTDEVKRRLTALAGSRVSDPGVIVITARTFRSQDKNRADAVERLTELIKKAAKKPRRRIKTRATLASKRRRLESKKKRAATKRMRSSVKKDNSE